MPRTKADQSSQESLPGEGRIWPPREANISGWQKLQYKQMHFSWEERGQGGCSLTSPYIHKQRARSQKGAGSGQGAPWAPLGTRRKEIMGEEKGEAIKIRPEQVSWGSRGSRNMPRGQWKLLEMSSKGPQRPNMPTLQLGLAPALQACWCAPVFRCPASTRTSSAPAGYQSQADNQGTSVCFPLGTCIPWILTGLTQASDLRASAQASCHGGRLDGFSLCPQI